MFYTFFIGCLQLRKTKFIVIGFDISESALSIAKEHRQNLCLGVEFEQLNALIEKPSQTFNVIVSNPPYIAREEESEIGEEVLRFEPHRALFAENNGLEFYIVLGFFFYYLSKLFHIYSYENKNIQD